MWRLWCKALGEKATNCSKESDFIAVIRTFIFLTYLITNGFIIANAIRHWNNVPQKPMGMFDTIKTSYDLGPGFYNKTLQTKDLDNMMEFYWIDPVGCLFKIEYSGTQAWEMKLPEDSKHEWDIFKIVPNGTHGKVSPCNITRTIEVYPEKWDTHYSPFPRKEITFFAGMLVVDGSGEPKTQEKIWETRYLSLKRWVEKNS